MTILNSFRKGIPYILLALVVFFSGTLTGYFYLRQKISFNMPFKEKKILSDFKNNKSPSLKIYSPKEGRLTLEKRRNPSKFSKAGIAQEVVNVYLSPYKAELIDFFMNKQGIAFLDISSELTKNFKGSLMDEYLLVSGLLKSLKANMSGLTGIQILIEGEEIETIGGHIDLTYPIVKGIDSIEHVDQQNRISKNP